MRRNYYISRLSLDLLLVTICFFTARSLFPYTGTGISNRGWILYAYCISFWYFASQITFLYTEFLSRVLSKEIISVLKTIFVQGAFTVIALFFASRSPMAARYFMASFVLMEIVLMPVVKYFTRWLYASTYYTDRAFTKILVVGAGPLGMDFYNIILKNLELRYKMEGFIDDEKKENLNGLYLGTIADFERILHEKEIEEVIVALPNTADEKIKHIVKVSDLNAVRVKIIPDYFKLSQNVSIDSIGNIPLITIRNIPLDSAEFRFFKRVFDIVFSVLVIVFIFSWLFPIIILCIKLTSKGPAFFVQERWGINNKRIVCYKFRSMHTFSTDTDEKGEYRQATKGDARITPVGRFLRKSNLDELPQFLNVMFGEMSIVGPRPHPIPLNLMSRSVVQNYSIRHLVKPGITGWAQVHGFRGETKEQHLMQKRVDFDIWYIENWSLWLDCQIIIQTVINMIKGEKNAY